MVKSSGNSICTQNYSNFVSQNNRYIYAYVQRVIKADFLLSFVTRCCSALDRGKIKPQKSTGKVLVRVQYIVMQSLVYITRMGEYGTPVCTLGIHSITQLEGKNKNSSTRAEQVFNRFLCVHFTRDRTCPANIWSQRRCQLKWLFFPTALFVALNPAWQTSIMRSSNPFNWRPEIEPGSKFQQGQQLLPSGPAMVQTVWSQKAKEIITQSKTSKFLEPIGEMKSLWNVFVGGYFHPHTFEQSISRIDFGTSANWYTKRCPSTLFRIPRA